MAKVPTVRIESKDTASGYVVVNEADFVAGNFGRSKLYEDKPAPKPKPKESKEDTKNEK